MLESSTDLELLYRAANAYYLHDKTQSEIAQELKVSRPTVSRLLTEARRIGMVSITVHEPGYSDASDLETDLAERLGLKSVRIAAGNQTLREYAGLATLVGEQLSEIGLTSGDIILISSGRTTWCVSGADTLPRLPGVTILPMVGGQQEHEAWFQTNETARRFAEMTGAEPRYIFAPALPSEQLWESLKRDPSFVEILDLWDQADTVIAGIGGPLAQRPSYTSVIPDVPELEAAVGDICLYFYDRNAQIIEFPGSERIVRIPKSMLKAKRNIIGLGCGTEKADALIVAASSGFINSLITDSVTAKAMINKLS